MHNKILRPLRVFISSAMENSEEPWRQKIVDLRHSLNEKLKKYSFIEPFILEDDGSSVLGLNEEYITNLRDSNVVMVLLDSSKPIAPGVQKEITDARQNNIPRVYYIIPGVKDDAEIMKNKLLSQNENNYINVLSQSGDYALQIENQFLGQLVTVFKAYFSHQIINEKNENDRSNSISDPLTDQRLSFFNKEMFKSIGLSKQIIRELIYHNDIDDTVEEPESKLDDGISKLLKRIFLNETLPYGWNEIVVEGIKDSDYEDKLSKEFVFVISKRLEAVGAFFTGNHFRSFRILKNLLQSEEIEMMPNWLLQDILIDLRNLLNIEELLKNRFVAKNIYQVKLSNVTTPFYYPGIDHALKEVHSWVREERNNILLKQSGERAIYGSGINQYPDLITEASVFAICNGSIAQIQQIPQNMNIISEMLLMRYDNRIYFRDVLRNEILMGKPYSKINKWLRKYSYLLGQFSDGDAKEIIKAAHSYMEGNKRISIEATALRIVGDYLGDDDFNSEWSSLWNRIKNWLQSSELIVQLANEILGLFRYCFRIPQQDIYVLIDSLSNGARRYYDDIADIISGSLDYKNATVEQRNRVIDDLLMMISDDKSDVISPKLEGALMSVFTEWPEESKKLEEYIKKEKTSFYQKEIVPYIWNKSSDPNYRKFIGTQLKLIQSQNEEQMVNKITISGTDPFLNLYYVFERNNFGGQNEIDMILHGISESLMNQYQSIDNKKSAVKLMMMILLKNDNNIRQRLLDNIISQDIVAESNGFFEVESPTQYIEALRILIDTVLSGMDKGKLIFVLSLEHSAEYISFISDLLEDFIPLAISIESLNETLPQVLQFLITNNSHDNENTILLNIAKCLLSLSGYDKLSEIALGQLQKIISDNNDTVKRQLVVLINESNNKSDIFNPLKKQLLVSSNYSVRDLAIRDFK